MCDTMVDGRHQKGGRLMKTMRDKVEICRFLGEERPDGDIGDRIKMKLVAEDGSQREITATINWRENYPMGYFLDCQFLDGGDLYRIEAIIYDNSPENEGVKIYYAPKN